MTTPTPPPWDSPHVAIRKQLPKKLDIGDSLGGLDNQRNPCVWMMGGKVVAGEEVEAGSFRGPLVPVEC